MILLIVAVEHAAIGQLVEWFRTRTGNDTAQDELTEKGFHERLTVNQSLVGDRRAKLRLVAGA